MQATELIEQLQELIAREGDVDIAIRGLMYGQEEGFVSPYEFARFEGLTEHESGNSISFYHYQNDFRKKTGVWVLNG